MADYTKGITIKTIPGKFSEYMKVGINIEEFQKNPINDRGYVNFKITKSRKGEWYAVNNEQTISSKTNEQVETTSDKSEESDLPF